MKFFKALVSWTLTYKILAMFEALYYYIKERNIISETFYSHHFLMIIKKYLKCDLEKDWLGRLYGVINPYIDINGKLDITSMIVELDGEFTNNEEQLKNWIYKQMQLVSSLFKIENLYSYISLDIRHVGPINHDNYLIIFDITSRKYFSYCFKRVMKMIGIYLLIGIIALMFI